jgi:transposase-like protein
MDQSPPKLDPLYTPQRRYAKYNKPVNLDKYYKLLMNVVRRDFERIKRRGETRILSTEQADTLVKYVKLVRMFMQDESKALEAELKKDKGI